jgi:hypothetical protein
LPVEPTVEEVEVDLELKNESLCDHAPSRAIRHASHRSVGRVCPANAPCAARPPPSDLHVMNRVRCGWDETLDATTKKARSTERQSLEKMWMSLEETGGQCDMSVRDVMILQP